jgi:hypothetical protein
MFYAAMGMQKLDTSPDHLQPLHPTAFRSHSNIPTLTSLQQRKFDTSFHLLGSDKASKLIHHAIIREAR